MREDIFKAVQEIEKMEYFKTVTQLDGEA